MSATSHQTSIRSATRFLLGLLAVLVVVELASMAISSRTGFDPGWSNPTIGQRVTMVHSHNDVDVLFVGTSVVAAAVDPRTVLDQISGSEQGDLNGLNVALGAATPRTLSPWLGDVVLDQHCPQVVVIGISPRGWNANHDSAAATLASFADSTSYRELTNNGFRSTGQAIEALADGHSTMLAVRPLYQDPKSLLNAIRWGGPRPLTVDGRDQAFFGSIGPPSAEPNPELRQVLVDFDPTGIEQQSTIDMIETVRNAGATPVLVDMPVLKDDFVRSMPNGLLDWQRYKAAVTEVVAETGVNYVDLSEESGDRSGWQDEYHTNQQGWEHVSVVLGQELDGLNLFARSDTKQDCVGRSAGGS